MRGLLKLDAAVDLRRIEFSAHGGLHVDGAGGRQVAVELLNQGQVDLAVDAQVQRVLLPEAYLAAHGQSRWRGPSMRALSTVTTELTIVATIGPELRRRQSGRNARLRGRPEFHGGKPQLGADLLRFQERSVDAQFAFHRSGKAVGGARSGGEPCPHLGKIQFGKCDGGVARVVAFEAELPRAFDGGIGEFGFEHGAQNLSLGIRREPRVSQFLAAELQISRVDVGVETGDAHGLLILGVGGKIEIAGAVQVDRAAEAGAVLLQQS